MKSGIFTISIDFELLWGRLDKPDLEDFKKKVPQERIVIKKLLSLFSKYNIPATWATVGMLTKKGDRHLSGIDILKDILQVSNQEIASHSYTHPVFTQITRSEALEEFNKFKKKSFVFPRNKIKYLNELKSSGFRSYRGKDKNEYELLIPRTAPVYLPTINHGLVNIPGSMYFVSGRGLRKLIPSGIRYIKSKTGIDAAIKKRKVFHLWFHPADFIDDQNKIFNDFEKILIYASKMRNHGLLRILNMDQITKLFN